MRIVKIEDLHCNAGWRDFSLMPSVDVAIIDVAWNGILESVKIAAMADAYKINVAPHNFNGHIGSLMSAHLCAAIPDFRVMEIDIEDVPWKDDLVAKPPVIENGDLLIPTGIGWGAEVNEAVIRAHPPLRPVKWKGWIRGARVRFEPGAILPTLDSGTDGSGADDLHRGCGPRQRARPQNGENQT